MSNKVRIKHGWPVAGKTGIVLAADIHLSQTWTPLLWDGDDEPSLFNTSGLEFLVEKWESKPGPPRNLPSSKISNDLLGMEEQK